MSLNPTIGKCLELSFQHSSTAHPLKPMRWWSITRASWTLLLMTWTFCFLQKGLYLLMAVTLALTVAQGALCLTDRDQRIRDPAYVIYAALSIQAWSYGRQCMETLCRLKQATTSASITGMSGLVSSCLRNLAFQMTRCCKLLDAYAVANTPLSTKTSSARYSDL